MLLPLLALLLFLPHPAEQHDLLFAKPAEQHDLITTCPATTADVTLHPGEAIEMQVVTPGETFRVQLPQAGSDWSLQGSRQAAPDLIAEMSASDHISSITGIKGPTGYVEFFDITMDFGFSQEEDLTWRSADKSYSLQLRVIPGVGTIMYTSNDIWKSRTVSSPTLFTVILPNPTESSCPDEGWALFSITEHDHQNVRVVKGFASYDGSFYNYTVEVLKGFVGPTDIHWVHKSSLMTDGKHREAVLELVTIAPPPVPIDYYFLYKGEIGQMQALNGRDYIVKQDDIIGTICERAERGDERLYRISLTRVLLNNLGRQGPDQGEEGLMFEAKGTWFDQLQTPHHENIVIRMHAAEGYLPWEGGHDNGLAGETRDRFAQICQASGQSSEIRVTFWEHDGVTPLDFHGNKLAMVIYDMDTGDVDTEGRRGGVEFVEVSGVAYSSRSKDTTIKEEKLPDHRIRFSASIFGTGSDNPTDPDNLVGQQANKAVVLVYDQPAEIKMMLGSTDLTTQTGKGPRFTMMTFTDHILCHQAVVGHVCHHVPRIPVTRDSIPVPGLPEGWAFYQTGDGPQTCLHSEGGSEATQAYEGQPSDHVSGFVAGREFST